MSTEQPTRGKTLALTGAFFQLGPLIGTAGTAIGMMRTAKTPEGNSGISDPQQLSANIGQVLITTAIGLGFSLVGLVFICTALFASRYRARRFFWFLIIYGGILLRGFPIGTVVGIILLVYCFINKAEFLGVYTSGRNA